MTIYLQEEKYVDAVKMLRNQSMRYIERRMRPPEKIETLFYKFSPTLMEHAPEATVASWMALGRALDPCKLIPALVRYSQRRRQVQSRDKRKGELEKRLRRFGGDGNGDGDDANSGKDILADGENVDHAVRYLEHCVSKNRNRDPSIHNFLLSLYAQIEDGGSTVIGFLRSQGAKPCFDLDYALRVCTEAGHTRACVMVYSMMTLTTEAVSLALDLGDVNLAKEHVNAATNDDELRRKLWLRIARHVIEKEKDIKQAIMILKESGDLLKIEDILPLFPDFTVIDDFKDEICEALEQYNEKITLLKAEMNDYVDSAEQIRKDIKSLRSRTTLVHKQAKCEISGRPIAGEKFYVFPDGRTFICDELLKWMLPHLSGEDKQRVETIKRELDSLAAAPSDKKVDEKIGELEQQLDDIIGSSWQVDDVLIGSINAPLDEGDENWEL